MSGISVQQLLILAILFFFAVSIMGCFILVAAGRIVPF